MVEEGFVDLPDGVRLRYLRSGTGPRVVLMIPGWTMHAEVFEHQLAHLARDPGLTVVAYDPRSHGKSTMTERGNHAEQHGEDLRALLDALGIDACVVVAWSAGSVDLIAHLRLHGAAWVRGIVLIDIPPTSRGHDATTDWVEYGTKEDGDQDDVLRFFCHDLLVDRRAVTMRFAASMLEDPTPEAVEFFTHMSFATPLQTAVVLNLEYWFIDGADDIAALDGRVPMLFVVRREKELLARRWAAEHTPGVTVVSYGAHAMFWEDPERFDAALSDFLAAIP